jgi:hypothetical protein
MKRLLIALGALTLVSSAAVAAEDFRPTGSVKQEIRWYGDQEEVDQEGLRFTMAEGGVRFTEKFYIDYRVRDYIRYHSDEGSNTKSIRTRLYYDHGTLGDSQVTMRERFGVEGTASNNTFYYTPEFNFSNYFEEGDYFSVDTLKIRPAVRYQDDNNANKTAVSGSLDFLSVYSFPAVPGDLSVEFNVYGGYLDDSTATKDGKSISDERAVWVELYGYYAYELGTWNGLDFTAYYEFGLDPLKVYEEERDTTQRDRDTYDKEWTIYNDFELQASYKVNASTSIYGAIAAEYGNTKGEEYASYFKWFPYAYVGWRTKF